MQVLIASTGCRANHQPRRRGGRGEGEGACPAILKMSAARLRTSTGILSVIVRPAAYVLEWRLSMAAGRPVAPSGHKKKPHQFAGAHLAGCARRLFGPDVATALRQWGADRHHFT